MAEHVIRLQRRTPSGRLAYLAGKRAGMVERGQDTTLFDALFTPVGREAAAQVMAEPLRRALDRHLDEHRCGEGDFESPDYIGGFLNCPEAAELWELLPDGDRIMLA